MVLDDFDRAKEIIRGTKKMSKFFRKECGWHHKLLGLLQSKGLKLWIHKAKRLTLNFMKQ